MLRISIAWRNDDPSTIYNVLKRKLGREPTNAELIIRSYKKELSK